VRWRTGRHREALWKSQVLPASGVALCWLLLMTLWLPLLDYARSNRPLAQRLSRHLPAQGCVAAPDASPALVVALEWHARRTVDARGDAAKRSGCTSLVLAQRGSVLGPEALAVQAAGWVERARVRRPTDRQEITLVFVRAAR